MVGVPPHIPDIIPIVDEHVDSRRARVHKVVGYIFWLGFILLAALVIRLTIIAPRALTKGTIIHVENGESLSAISENLWQEQVITSRFFFETLVILYGNDRHIRAGDYYLADASPLYVVARNIARGDFNITPTKVTLPEGLTVEAMATIFKTKLPYFDTARYQTLTKDQEGYLFPDTYFFSPFITTDALVATLESTFTKKLTPLADDISASGHSEYDIITMASIVEKEAGSIADQSTIAGIFWNRLQKGMMLQTDAALGYVTGKASEELTMSDLKLDSPYNLYVHKGLPPTPIDNPGLSAIQATLHPNTTGYLFFLYDHEGTIHYATTFEEHKKNKALYLN